MRTILFNPFSSPTLRRFRTKFGYFWDDYSDVVSDLERKSWRREHKLKASRYKDLHYHTF